MRIAYARESSPSARKLAEVDENIELVRSTYERVDINWGRHQADSDLNPDIGNSVNKRVMRELFRKHDVPTPRLYSAQEICSLYVAGKTPKVVGRPDTHSRKRGFWLISDIARLNRALLGTRLKRPATHFMEYISKDRAPREYRVHVFKGRVIRLSEKDFSQKTEDRDYTTVPPSGELSHIRSAAIQAITAVGLDFGAVDILANDAECWVLEVNSAPGLGGTMPEVYIRAFNNWKEGL